MNERIRELAEQAGLYDEKSPDEVPEFTASFEKFAKLIVRECGVVINSENYREHSKGWNDAIVWADGMIKEHFGVQE